MVRAVPVVLKRRCVAFATGAVLALILAPAASAQVNYDPSSAAGKQYEIPVNTARQDGGGGGSSGGSVTPSSSVPSGSDAALFGQGVKPASTPKNTAGSTAKKANPDTSTSAAPRPKTPASVAATAAKHAAQAATNSGGGGSAWLLYAAGAILVCLLLTLTLRRSGAGGPPAPAA